MENLDMVIIYPVVVKVNKARIFFFPSRIHATNILSYMFAELQFQLVMRGLLPAVLTGNGNEGADEGATILQLTGVWRVF